MNSELLNLFASFSAHGTVLSIDPFGHGHINDTFRVITQEEECPDYILQRKNHTVFRDIPGMMDNIVKVTGHIRKKLMAEGVVDPDRKVMKYIPSFTGNYFVQDAKGNFWTLFIFVKDCHGIEEVTNPAQAYSAGKAFGHFQFQLSDLPGNQLIETIPGFHNGKNRLAQFKEAVKSDNAGRVKEVWDLIAKITNRADQMTQIQDWLDKGILPIRITHNDTKINNVLFDDEDHILCIIDLDTVMPGSALFDFGDAIRTLGNTAVEDEPDPVKIGFNQSYYRAFTEGYLSESQRFLTKIERENLAFSCQYMVWEQAMRFLADYLNGDTYYKTAYSDHNKIRALSQIRYLEILEENSDFMKAVVSAT